MMDAGQKRYWIYIIWNARHGRYYVGQTSDLEVRIAQHNDLDNDLSKFTKRFDGCWQLLLYSETFATRREAIQRERSLKGGQERQWIKDTLLPPPD